MFWQTSCHHQAPEVAYSFMTPSLVSNNFTEVLGMGNRIILCLLLLFGLPLGVHAQRTQLSLQDAVDAALAPGGNKRMQLAKEAIRQAEARAAETRAELLPDISASVGQQSRTRNLAEFGLNTENMPNVVGPFNTFDARGSLSMKLLDLSSI